jgi:hypothetical protein
VAATNQIAQQVLSAVYARLSASGGFNAGIIAQAPLYGLPTNFIQLDWSPTSQNFFFDQIDPDSVEATGIISYPGACLYVDESFQTGVQKFTKFSGTILIVFEVWLSWVPMKEMQLRENYSNCVEDVVVDVINRVSSQNWGFPLVYNGMMRCKRGQTRFGAQNFKKKLSFSMVFELHQ